MNEPTKRGLLYGFAVLILGGLGTALAKGHAEADVATLLSSIDVQLRLAHGIPATDKQGRELTARTEMIAAAEQQIASVERQEPGMAVTAEFQGFALMLRGKFADAAVNYRRAQACSDVLPEQRDVLAFNEARMLALAGDRQQALAVFTAHGQALDARYGHQRSLEEAAILRELGRRVEATQRLDVVLRDTTAAPMAWLQAGQQYALLGHNHQAEGAFSKAASSVPIADYYLALLKLQQGEFDNCLQLLERVAKALPAEVKRRIQDEPGAWSAVAKDTRFQELSAPLAATPGR